MQNMVMTSFRLLYKPRCMSYEYFSAANLWAPYICHNYNDIDIEFLKGEDRHWDIELKNIYCNLL